MKKIVATTFTLLVLAGSTFAVATPNAVAQTGSKQTKPQSQTIPPPVCPADDPNGCGIFN